MKRSPAVIVFLTALLGWSGTAPAYDVVGVGNWACEAWTYARKTHSADTPEQWTLGFISGIGARRPRAPRGIEPLRGFPPQELSDYLDTYCQANPKDTIAHAVETFSATRPIFSAPVGAQ